MEKHNKLNFTIPESVEAILRKIASETGLKLSTIVAKAIEEYNKNHGTGN